MKRMENEEWRMENGEPKAECRMQNDEARILKKLRARQDGVGLTLVQSSSFIILHSAFSFWFSILHSSFSILHSPKETTWSS